MNDRYTGRTFSRTAHFLLACGVAGGLVACQIADPKPRNAERFTSPGPAQLPSGGEVIAPAPQPKTAQAPAPGPARAVTTASQARERAIEIIEGFAKSADPQLRGNAVELAAIAPKRLHSVLQNALLDPNPGVRSVAVVAAGRNKMQEFREIIRPLVRDQNGSVRAGAIYALDRFGDAPDQTPLATMLLKDDSPWVNRQAAFVLGELGNPTALPLLKSAWVNRLSQVPPAQQRIFQVQLTEAMVKLGDEDQRAALIAALYPTQADDFEVAMLAVQSIGETGDRSAVPQLIGIAQYKDREGKPYPAELRLAVASTLGRLGIDSGLLVADEYAASKDEGLRAQAAHAYGHIGGGGGGGMNGPMDALSRIVPLMEDLSDLVRLAAAGAALRCTK